MSLFLLVDSFSLCRGFSMWLWLFLVLLTYFCGGVEDCGNLEWFKDGFCGGLEWFWVFPWTGLSPQIYLLRTLCTVFWTLPS